MEICMGFLEEGEGRTKGSHFSGELSPDDKLSVCPTFLLFCRARSAGRQAPFRAVCVRHPSWRCEPGEGYGICALLR